MVCVVAGLGGNPYHDGSYEYYVNEQLRENDPKAVGPFIMARIEYKKLTKWICIYVINWQLVVFKNSQS